MDRLIRPHCIACLRRASDPSGPISPLQLVRGKKKLARQPASLKVRLLVDIPRYGRQGAIIPIAPGRMRNDWYPRRRAEYLTATQMRQMSLQDAVTERDFNFKPNQQAKKSTSGRTPDISEPVNVKLDLLSPQRTIELLSNLIPPRIEFYRPTITPVAPPHTSSQPQASSTPDGSVAGTELDLASATASEAGTQPLNIYGSVSNADVAANIKAILVRSEEGARVVLGAEDITFETRSQDGVRKVDRVKQLGEYEIVIGSKGASETVRRKVTVLAQEAQAN